MPPTTRRLASRACLQIASRTGELDASYCEIRITVGSCLLAICGNRSNHTKSWCLKKRCVWSVVGVEFTATTSKH